MRSQTGVWERGLRRLTHSKSSFSSSSNTPGSVAGRPGCRAPGPARSGRAYADRGPPAWRSSIRLVKSRSPTRRWRVARTTICWRSGNWVSGFCAPAKFPANRAVTRHSLSSTGFPRVEFPCFMGTTEYSDFPPLVRPRFGVPSLGRTFPCACVRWRRTRRRPRGLELWVWQPRRKKLRKGNDGTSQVPGESSCAYALFFDPGRTDFARTYSGVDAAPMLTTTKSPANLGTFEAQSHGLCTRCLRFALGIAPPGRKTRFPLLSALRAGIGYPQDSNERFPSCFLHLFFLSQACLTQCQRSPRHRPGYAEMAQRTKPTHSSAPLLNVLVRP
jgi:hypothetical protein